MKKQGRNRKRYNNDVREIKKRLGVSHNDARALWRLGVDREGGKRSAIKRGELLKGARASKKEIEKQEKAAKKVKVEGEILIGVIPFMALDGYMTDAIRKGFSLRFELGPWFTANGATPMDESEAMELRREMRDDGDSFFGSTAHKDDGKSSDSWRIQDWIKVWVNPKAKYYRFKWVQKNG